MDLSLHPPSGSTTSPVAARRAWADRLSPTALLLVTTLLVRLPFLWHGFGVHPDEAGVLRSGIEMWLDGRFYISRPPGYPLNEFLMGGLALLGGGPLCALAAAVASCVAVVALERWLRAAGVRHAVWIALAFAVHPWLWRSSTHALDYIWAMMSLCLAGRDIQTGRYRWGALWCALGIGFRWSSVLWVGPLWAYAWYRQRSRREAALFAGVVAVVGTILLLPALLGTRHWAGEGGQYTFLTPTVRRLVLFGYHVVEFWGHVFGVVVIGVAWWLGRRQPSTPAAARPDWLPLHGAIVVLYVALFWLHSDKCEYFLPVLPSALFLMSRAISRRGWQAIALVFLFNGLVTLRVGHWPRSGVRFMAPHFEAGAVLRDNQHRAETAERVNAFWRGLQEPDATVVVPGLQVMEELNVFARLGASPASRVRIEGWVVPGMYHLRGPDGCPCVEFWPVRRTGDEKSCWPVLIHPATGAVAVDGMCVTPADQVARLTRQAYHHQASRDEVATRWGKR